MQDIRLFNTKILTFNNEEVIIPNSDVLSETLINESNRPLRRVEIAFYVSYSADAVSLRAEMEKLLAENENILQSPAPRVVFDSFGESTVRCTAYAWAAIDSYTPAKLATRDIIYATLKKFGAEPSSRKFNVNVLGTKEDKDV